jgi:hypothetical protein
MQIMQSRNDLTIINFPASLALSSAALKRFQADKKICVAFAAAGRFQAGHFSQMAGHIYC